MSHLNRFGYSILLFLCSCQVISMYILKIPDNKMMYAKIMELLKPNAGQNDIEMELEFRGTKYSTTRLVPRSGLRRQDFYYNRPAASDQIISRNDINWLKKMLRGTEGDATENTDLNKPVLMKDLHEELVKLENRLTESLKNLSLDNSNKSTTVDALLYEATKPVYMKDLWKYVGKNFMNGNAGCEYSSCEDQGGIEDLMRPGSGTGTGNLDNVMGLLQKANSVKAIGSKLPEGKDISWLKVRVPK